MKTEELRLVFEIKSGSTEALNQSYITIYNLSRATRNNLRTELLEIVLTAGYQGNAGIIFTGSLIGMSVEQDDGDIKTVLNSGDGYKELKGAIANQSFKKNTPLSTVINYLISTTKSLTPGKLNGITGKRLKTDIILVGNTDVFIKALGLAYDFRWSIQGGIFETVEVIRTKAGSEISDTGGLAYEISSTTGLISKPIIEDSGQVVVKVLLNPRLKPNRPVYIDSPTLEGRGLYRIVEINTKGDTHGQDWYSLVKCVPKGKAA